MNVCIFVFKMEMNRMKKELDIITFDADDTLWENELFFRENEHRFCELIKEYADQDQILESLLKNEIKTLPIYGYGIKGFVLSMIETALELSNNKISGNTIKEILELGKKQAFSSCQINRRCRGYAICSSKRLYLGYGNERRSYRPRTKDRRIGIKKILFPYRNHEREK